MLTKKLVSLVDISKNNNLRICAPFQLPNCKYDFISLIKMLKYYEAGSRPKGGIQYCDYDQALSLGGEQIGADGSVELSKAPYVSYEFYEECSKGKVQNGDILICKDGALTGKSCLVNTDLIPSNKIMVNEHVYVLRGNESVNQIFLFYLTRTNLFKMQVKDLAYRKKGQPGLNQEHLKQLKLPDVPFNIQEKIICKVLPLEQEIQRLKASLKRPLDIMDSIFMDILKINIPAAYSVSQTQRLQISTAKLALNNTNIRTSYRWCKLIDIQKNLFMDCKYIHKLGEYLTDTQNGWSPLCTEASNKLNVLGIDAINQDGILTFNNVKFSDDDSKKNISDFIIHKGDFFVSRGNTTQLVALSSVVENDLEDDYIFSDLMIRLSLNEKMIEKKYLTYVFNSSIGRLYFKYAAKGKNQTMVKVSSKELTDFLIPVPDLPIQKHIVLEISKQLEEQNTIRNKMTAIRNEIDTIVESTIFVQQ